MRAELRILRIVQPDHGGPRKRTLLDAAATRYGATKNARWGLPKARRRA